MSKERYIELQLIKPIDSNSTGTKGKISIKKLLKEYFNLLNVPYEDICCPTEYQDGFFIEVNTYEEMLQYANGDHYKKFLVVDDENKSLEFTTYEWWPKNQKLMWIASTEEIIS